METFPAFFPLRGRRVVIAGDGEGAEAKARLFHGSPAEVVRLTPDQARDPSAYRGADLVFVASPDAGLAAAAAAAARAAGLPVNVVDRPELSDFHTPAIIDRGQVVAAIGTAGAAPLLAALLRAEMEARIPSGAGRLAALLGGRREALRDAFPDLPARRAFLRAILAGPIAEAVADDDMTLAAARLDEAIRDGWTALGRISFVEIPPSADLLSLRSVRMLNIADILLVGPRASPLVDAHARRDAEHWRLEATSEEALRTEARAGRLIAILGHPDPDPLAARLTEGGIRVERLAPAPAS